MDVFLLYYTEKEYFLWFWLGYANKNDLLGIGSQDVAWLPMTRSLTFLWHSDWIEFTAMAADYTHIDSIGFFFNIPGKQCNSSFPLIAWLNLNRISESFGGHSNRMIFLLWQIITPYKYQFFGVWKSVPGTSQTFLLF